MELNPQLENAEDVEEVTRKRARIEARRKFRIVASTIVACSRFTSGRFTSHIVLEVEAEKPEQAESEIIAALSRATLDVQSSSDDSVDFVSRAEGELINLPNATNDVSVSFPNPGYSATGRGKSAQYEQTEGEMLTLPNDGFVSFPSQGYFTASPEGQGEITLPKSSNYGTPSIPSLGYTIAEQKNEGEYNQAEGKCMTVQDVQKFMEEVDVPDEGLESVAGVWSDWKSLDNLWSMNDNTEDWRALASELNDKITHKIQELESGSGRSNFHKLVEEAEEITKKIGTPGSASEGNKFRNMDAKASTTTLPTVRDCEQYLSDVLEKLQSHVSELCQNVHGRQKQLANFASMSRLIQSGRKALQTLGLYTNSISGKLNTLVKGLKCRELDVEKHFNKCAASISTVVQSVLEKEKGNFVSIASVREWYFDEMSSRQNLTESFSPISDAYKFLPVL